MVGVTKLRIKFGPEGSVKTFQTFPDSNVKKIEQPITGVDVVIKPSNLSKKRGATTELEEFQAKKKMKLDHDLSSQCLRLLRLLRDHEFGWLFGDPVDPVRLMIPDYFSVVSKPMDLGTIKSKLLKSGYSRGDEFAADLRIKKLDEGFGVSSTLKTPSKGSAPTTAFKCGSCGRVSCICLKSCTSSGSEVSSLTDCQLTNTSGPQASESDPHSNGSVNSKNEKNGCVSSQLDKPSNIATEVKTTIPAMPPLPPEKALRAAIVKAQFAETILRAKHRKVLDQKVDLIQIQIEKEQMEKAQREEKARIEAEIRAAQIATRMRKETELNQRRERQRLELQKMKITYDFEENNFFRLEKDLIRLCGRSNPTRSRMIELGLFLRNDDRMEEIDLEFSDAMRVDDLEEGEIS